VIEGATNATSSVPTGSYPVAVAVNPISNQIYVADSGDNTFTVIDEQQVQPIPLQANITALAGNMTGSLTPAFNFTASSDFAPFAPNPDNLLYQVDTWQGPWTAATAQGNGAFTGTTMALQPGPHILYAYVTDGQDATTKEKGTSLISNIIAYEFLVSPAVTTLSLTPTSLSFGNQAVATTSAAKTVTMKNIGTGQLTFSNLTITGANAGDFAQTNNCPGSLATGKSCTVHVTFTPSATAITNKLGTRSAILELTDDAQSSPQTLSLSGTAAQPVTLSTNTFAFGNQGVQSSSAAKTVALTNNNSVTLTFDSIVVATLPPGNSGDFAQSATTCAASLGAHARCTVSVTYTPTVQGAEGGTLTFIDGASNSPQTVSLTGTGVAQFKLSAASINFGNEAYGSTSAAKSVTLTNNTSAAASISSISIGGTNSTNFTQSATTCGSSLNGHSSCSISFTFSPTAVAAYAAMVSIADGASNSPQTVSLSGKGIAP
jgi:hypothetical protein